jgi:CDGSH-type Zn-finger protein
MSTKRNAPFVQDMQPGSYAWCACGESANQPFCDGSHRTKNTGMTPVRVTIDAAKKTAWCGCKESGNKPFCDGTHSKLK